MKLLTVLLLLTCSTLFAQTGAYMDRTVIGEGITTYEHVGLLLEESADFRTFYFYTHGEEQCEIVGEPDSVTVDLEVTAKATAECPKSIFPPFKPLCDPVVVEVTESDSKTAHFTDMSKTCDLNGQRWFLGSDPIDSNDDAMGNLYLTDGMDFP
ncbi:unnamed protein product, partial [marine sediment metagenome]